MMGWGTSILGYRHPVVESAVRTALERGATPSLTTTWEIEAAERLRDVVPGAHRIAFGKNGSDVLAMAVRAARAYTGREQILFHGYHGIHDWYMAGLGAVPGVPEALRETIRPFPYGDLEALRQIVQCESRGIAAVVMEPVQSDEPPPGYLEGVRRLCTEHGIVLVFDEIMTGLRLAPGGAQEWYGVRADLTVLAKCLGNGLPITALAGPDLLDQALAACHYGLTFRGEVLSLAAACATLGVLDSESVHARLRAAGERIRAAWTEAAKNAGVPVELAGPPSRMSFRLIRGEEGDERALLTLLVQECLRRGLLHHTALMISYAHTDRDVDECIETLCTAADVLGAAHAGGAVRDRLDIPLFRTWLRDEGES